MIINNGTNNITSSGIPHTFFANTSLIKSTGSQYDKFKFPSKDRPLTEAGKLEISKLESLEYVVNLLCGRLDLDLKNLFANDKYDVVIHLAASKSAPDSMLHPYQYAKNNIWGSINLIRASVKYGVKFCIL